MSYNAFTHDTPARIQFRIPQLSPGESDTDTEGTSPCRSRQPSMMSGTALRDASSRANMRANRRYPDLSLGDLMADMTQGCHISSDKQTGGSRGAMHAGRASSLPYPPQLFRNIDLQGRNTACRSSTMAAPQSPLESPFASPVASPITAPHTNPFDALSGCNGSSYRSSSNELGPTDSTASLVSPVCTELDSEFGTEIETDIDSETEPETEIELETMQQHQYFRQQHSVPPFRLSYFRPEHKTTAAPAVQFAQAHQALPTPVVTQRVRETSTPMIRPRHMYHYANKSAIGISFSTNDEGMEDGDDTFEDSTSPAPAPHSQRASFDRARMWMPPAKVRRTQSMFATPEQLLHEQVGQIERPMNHMGQPEDSFTGIVGSAACPLATYSVKQDPFKRISHQTLCRLLDGEFSSLFHEIVVIDCRFEYEYEGGHITGALNVNSKHQLEQVMFKERTCELNQSVLLVFHCEHSAYRSPLLASHLRQWDRHLNAPHYPRLFYPDVVVLDGGYSQFYTTSAHRCEPQNYVGMDHQEHRETCEREMSRFRNGMRARKLPTFNTGGSTPNLHEFRFPRPAPALRSVSVAEIVPSTSKMNENGMFGL